MDQEKFLKNFAKLLGEGAEEALNKIEDKKKKENDLLELFSASLSKIADFEVKLDDFEKEAASKDIKKLDEFVAKSEIPEIIETINNLPQEDMVEASAELEPIKQFFNELVIGPPVAVANNEATEAVLEITPDIPDLPAQPVAVNTPIVQPEAPATVPVVLRKELDIIKKTVDDLKRLINRQAQQIIVSGSHGGGETWLHRLDDVSYQSLKNVTDGQVLTYDASLKKWIAADSQGGGGSGFRGSVGFSGSAGTAGLVGYTGSAGAGTGFQGSQGNVGYQGSASVGGFVGSQGATGFTGSKGADGVSGTSGFVGSIGSVGFSGSAGFIGSAGTSGYQGSFGGIGFKGSAGDAGATGYTGSVGFAGSVGPQGAGGATGYTGSTGDLGYTGSRGIDGFTGSSGIDGYTGSKGDIGYTGSAGYIGADGYTGSTGFTGSAGFTGSKGDTGFVGSKGDIGYTGSKGDIGYTGSKGDTGFVGSKGDTGPQGIPGSFGGAAFEYIFEDIITDTVAPGYARMNDSPWIYPAFANTLYLAFSDVYSDNCYSFITTIDDSTSSIKGHFSIVNKANVSNRALFAIIGNVTTHGSHFHIPISYISGDTALTTDPANVIFTFARTGDIGDRGYTGSKGDTGFVGSTGTAGTQGFVGSIGYAGSIGYTGSLPTGVTSNQVNTITLDAGYKFIPATDGSQDLGSPTNRFKSLYLSGNTLYVGNVSLSESGGALQVTQSNGYVATVATGIGFGNTDGQMLLSNTTATYWHSLYTLSATPPTNPNYGDIWYYTVDEKPYMWVKDNGGSFWLDFLPSAS